MLRHTAVELDIHALKNAGCEVNITPAQWCAWVKSEQDTEALPSHFVRAATANVMRGSRLTFEVSREKPQFVCEGGAILINDSPTALKWRYFPLTKSAHFAFMETRSKGSGVGRKVTREAIHRLFGLGVTEYTITCMHDLGPYVWARAGVTPVSPFTLNHVRSIMIETAITSGNWIVSNEKSTSAIAEFIRAVENTKTLYGLSRIDTTQLDALYRSVSKECTHPLPHFRLDGDPKINELVVVAFRACPWYGKVDLMSPPPELLSWCKPK